MSYLSPSIKLDIIILSLIALKLLLLLLLLLLLFLFFSCLFFSSMFVSFDLFILSEMFLLRFLLTGTLLVPKKLRMQPSVTLITKKLLGSKR